MSLGHRRPVTGAVSPGAPPRFGPRFGPRLNPRFGRGLTLVVVRVGLRAPVRVSHISPGEHCRGSAEAARGCADGILRLWRPHGNTLCLHPGQALLMIYTYAVAGRRGYRARLGAAAGVALRWCWAHLAHGRAPLRLVRNAEHQFSASAGYPRTRRQWTQPGSTSVRRPARSRHLGRRSREPVGVGAEWCACDSLRSAINSLDIRIAGFCIPRLRGSKLYSPTGRSNPGNNGWPAGANPGRRQRSRLTSCSRRPRGGLILQPQLSSRPENVLVTELPTRASLARSF